MDRGAGASAAGRLRLADVLRNDGAVPRIAAKERFRVRYLSDVSYWLYLCHLPPVLAGQMLTVD